MAVVGIQTRIVQVVEHPALIAFNQEFGAKSDLSRYASVASPERFTSAEVLYLNQLQLDFYIPANTALLIKNNLHDLPFAIQTTRSALYALRQSGKIGEACFRFLHEKLNAKDLLSTFRYLYIIMLYTKIAEERNRRVAGPRFQFESAACYSDKLIKAPDHVLTSEENTLQSSSRKEFLKTYLSGIALRPNCPRDAHQQIHSLIHLLDQQRFQEFRTSFLQLLEMLGRSSELEKICWEEIRLPLSSYQGAEFFDQAYLQLKTEDYYRGACLSRLVTLRQSLESTQGQHLLLLTEKCKKAYNGCIHLFGDSKNMPACSPTRFAALIGKMRTEWQAISNAFDRAQQQVKHLFCACQTQPPPYYNKLAAWPFHQHLLIDSNPPPRPQQVNNNVLQENQQKTIAVIGCKWGGGHLEVSRGIANNLSAFGYHPITVDLPEVLISEDPIHNFWITRWLGKSWSMGTFFEGLLEERAFAFIDFLKWVKGKFFSSFGYSDAEFKLVIQHLLKLNPDAVITTYSAHNESLIQACKVLGIPCIHIATDVDTSIETRNAPPAFQHFKMAIPFNAPESIGPILTKTTQMQRFVSGPPVRHSFTQQRSESDIRELKEKWSIDANKKVVVISSGKNGAFSPYAEILAQKYAYYDVSDIPIHLVVICGKTNKDFKRHLEQNVATQTRLPMTIELRYDEEKMEELMSMASYGGAFVGKAGGSTIFETFSRGTRILIDDVQPRLFSHGFHHFWITAIERFLRFIGFAKQLPWEKVNMDFAKKNGLADTFENESDFLPKLERMLNNDGRPIRPPIEIKNIEETIPQTLRYMLIQARIEQSARRAREAYRAL